MSCFAITEVKVQEYTKNNFSKDLNEKLGKEQEKNQRCLCDGSTYFVKALTVNYALTEDWWELGCVFNSPKRLLF